MADYTRRRVTTTTHEFVLPLPAYWGELYKMLDAINAEDISLLHDDAVKVEVNGDDELVLSYEVNATRSINEPR